MTHVAILLTWHINGFYQNFKQENVSKDLFVFFFACHRSLQSLFKLQGAICNLVKEHGLIFLSTLKFKAFVNQAVL
jgi:hypothetical protein